MNPNSPREGSEVIAGDYGVTRRSGRRRRRSPRRRMRSLRRRRRSLRRRLACSTLQAGFGGGIAVDRRNVFALKFHNGLNGPAFLLLFRLKGLVGVAGQQEGGMKMRQT